MKKRIIMALVTMLICGSICAQEQHYTFNYHEFQHQMTAIVQVNIDGVEQTSSDIELGAFNGETVTGSERIGVYGSAGYHRVYLAVYFNQVYDVSFKIYNHQTGVELDNYNVTFEGEPFTMACVPDAAYGLRKNPIVINFTSSSTFTKDITPYTEGTKDHYYLIASPIGEVSPENVTNMLSNSYDLYYFNQSASDGLEWINYEGTDGNFNLVPGKGYLYANSGDGDNNTVTLTFSGTPYNGDGQVTLLRDDDADLPGWNLIGNPFAQTAYISNREFYVMNGDGSEIISSARTDNHVEAMEGIFVVANQDNETMTFSTTQPENRNQQLVVNVTQNRGASTGSATTSTGSAIDRAIVRFGEEATLPKFQLNLNHTKVYIPQGGHDFAVVRSANEGELPVNFKAEKNGSYTLNFEVNDVELNYLHLIDNLTGADVDLLAPNAVIAGEDPQSPAPAYTFDARTTDYASRFRLVFSANGASTAPTNFAYFNGSNWIVSNLGEATLQVIDVIGRVLSSEAINGNAEIRLNQPAGVYMLRLINGDDVKVQKIVVR